MELSPFLRTSNMVLVILGSKKVQIMCCQTFFFSRSRDIIFVYTNILFGLWNF